MGWGVVKRSTGLVVCLAGFLVYLDKDDYNDVIPQATAQTLPKLTASCQCSIICTLISEDHRRIVIDGFRMNERNEQYCLVEPTTPRDRQYIYPPLNFGDSVRVSFGGCPGEMLILDVWTNLGYVRFDFRVTR